MSYKRKATKVIARTYARGGNVKEALAKAIAAVAPQVGEHKGRQRFLGLLQDAHAVAPTDAPVPVREQGRKYVVPRECVPAVLPRRFPRERRVYVRKCERKGLVA